MLVEMTCISAVSRESAAQFAVKETILPSIILKRCDGVHYAGEKRLNRVLIPSDVDQVEISYNYRVDISLRQTIICGICIICVK